MAIKNPLSKSKSLRKVFLPWYATAAAVVLPPLVSFLTLRYFVRHFLQVRLGWVGFVDQDFLVPTTLAVFLFFYPLSRQEQPQLALRGKAILSSLGFFFIFLILNLKFASLASISARWFALVWALSVVCGLAFTFVWFVPVKFFLSRERRPLLYAAILIGSVNMISKILFSKLWQPTLRLTGQVMCSISSVLFPSVTCEFGPNVNLTSPYHCLSIGRGCSGLEGVFFFAFVFLFLHVAGFLKWRGRSGPLFVAGMFFFFFLNIFCIVIFMTLIAGAYTFFGLSGVNYVPNKWVHDVLGWGIYSLGIPTYFWLAGYLALRESFHQLALLFSRGGRVTK